MAAPIERDNLLFTMFYYDLIVNFLFLPMPKAIGIKTYVIPVNASKGLLHVVDVHVLSPEKNLV